MLFTDLVGLDAGFYRGKAVLDIGCGPRGSLEWADEASRRVGLDPLADDYRELGTDAHAMDYVAAGSEAMPFGDGEFDVVATINSLDHVDDLGRTVAEIKRVTRSVTTRPGPSRSRSLGTSAKPSRRSSRWSREGSTSATRGGCSTRLCGASASTRQGPGDLAS
jgi:SAM-dependent methyltransferase